MNENLLKYKGCLPDLKDERDYKALEILGKLEIKAPSFAEGYSVIKKLWPDMPYKNQGQTFSCVGQSWAYYKQILQFKDTGEKTELSAKSIYNPIAIPHTGSRVRDGGLRTVNYGVNKESTIPSNGTEDEITASFDFTPYASEATYYKNRITASVETQNFDILAKLIFLNDGVVSGWGQHAVWFEGYGTLNGKRYLHTPNSYGPGQDLYYFEGDSNKLFSIWTAIDVKNMPNNDKTKVRLIRAEGEQTVWFLLNGRRYWVFDPRMMADGVAEGIFGGFTEVEVLSKPEVYVFPKTDTPLGQLWKLYISK